MFRIWHAWIPAFSRSKFFDCRTSIAFTFQHCRCLSANQCIFISLLKPFEDTFLNADISLACFSLRMKILYNGRLYLLLAFLKNEDTLQRQIVSLACFSLKMKILFQNKGHAKPDICNHLTQFACERRISIPRFKYAEL